MNEYTTHEVAKSVKKTSMDRDHILSRGSDRQGGEGSHDSTPLTHLLNSALLNLQRSWTRSDKLKVLNLAKAGIDSGAFGLW